MRDEFWHLTRWVTYENILKHSWRKLGFEKVALRLIINLTRVYEKWGSKREID